MRPNSNEGARPSSTFESSACWSKMRRAEPLGQRDVDVGGTTVHSILELQSFHSGQRCFVFTPKIHLAANSFFFYFIPRYSLSFVYTRLYLD